MIKVISASALERNYTVWVLKNLKLSGIETADRIVIRDALIKNGIEATVIYNGVLICPNNLKQSGEKALMSEIYPDYRMEAA